ncbi:hypothetical protein [Actinopolymorpha pittospori]
MPWLAARNAAHAAPDPLPTRRVDLESAAGLTLAEPIDTPVALPAFDTAAMDGFAVAGDGPWQVVGRAPAGEVWTGPRVLVGLSLVASPWPPKRTYRRSDLHRGESFGEYSFVEFVGGDGKQIEHGVRAELRDNDRDGVVVGEHEG